MVNEKGKQSLKHRIRERTKRIKVPRKEKGFIKKDHSKRVAVVVWSLLASILLISVLTILLSVNTRSVLNETNAHFYSEDETDQQEEISIPSAEQFLSRFISHYVNVENSSEALEERKTELKSFMIQSEEFMSDNHELYQMPDIEGERMLDDYSLFDVKDEEDHTLFQYRVQFTNRIDVDESETDEDEENEQETEESSQRLLLNIPVVTDGEVFAVAATPYFTDEYSLKGSIEQDVPEEHVEEYTGAEQEAIQAFLVNFFERYASEEKEELAYMMREPESLNGAFLFDELLNVEISEMESGFKVDVDIRFREEMTNIPHVNSMEMKIENNEGNYFVEELNYQ
ncbi:conjugal transfer protein [Geomicrobium sediminis]|uniref:Conjugal transfer protein n=1 Tax=Geomicrobium sediminis TaxID=1347788 RepID=A0ABS2PG69_9BACL|nr:hypothetical protein [Geomicrobium sediminis]